MYLVVRKYKYVGNKQELSSKIDKGFVPLISKLKGFVDYYCMFADDSTLVSVSVFQDAKGAEESVRVARDFVVKNLTQYFPDKPEIFSGEAFTQGQSQGQEIRRAA